MSANDRQVGGKHYSPVEGEQHWDRVIRLKLNYFQAQITKYIERAPHKNGKQDVEKALHFCEKYLEQYDNIHTPGYALVGDEPRILADHSFNKGNLRPEDCGPEAVCNFCGRPKRLHPA